MSPRVALPSIAALMILASATSGGAQPADRSAAPSAARADGAPSVSPPLGYVIGASDVLSIVFWREKDMSADVVVRPDGKISLPLINELPAAGYTPEQLRDRITKAAERYIEDPNATVVVREIHSRNVFITGEIEKPGTYPLAGPMTVLQLIATAGGLKEYADKTKIVILRTENGRPLSYRFNYKAVVEQQRTDQNIELKPGDTVVVP